MSLFKYCLIFCLVLATAGLTAQEIKWMSWEEAAAANEKQPKKIFVDIYTDWCGWCKRMDATTFQEPAVIELLNSFFYAVKLNGEEKETISWNGQEFKWYPGGRNGVNKLAYELLDGQLSYPSFITLDNEYKRIMISPGYKNGDVLIRELKFAADNHYKTISWEDYKAKS